MAVARGAIADFSDPSQYELDSVQVTGLSDSRDEEWGAKLDLGHEFAMNNGTFTVQAGAGGRWRDKSYNLETQYWEMDGLTMTDFVGQQTYRIADISPVLDKRGVRASSTPTAPISNSTSSIRCSIRRSRIIR